MHLAILQSVKSAVVVISLATFTVPRTAVAQKAKLAVMPLAAQNIPRETVEILEGLLTGEIAAARRYQVLSVSDINAMLGLERIRDVAGCSDATCAAEIGGALGVRYLVTGSVGRMGGELLVQLSLIDVSGVSAVNRGRGIVKDDETLYRHAIEAATAELLGLEAPKATTTAATSSPRSTGVGTGKLSPARFRFDTGERQHEFQVEVTTMDGQSRRCNPHVRRSASCLLDQLAVGEARLSVSAEELEPFLDEFTVDDSDELFAIQIETIAGTGSVISWALGGVALAAGVALLATGLGTDIDGLVYGGVPTASVGLGVVILGFVFDRRIDVDYPGIDAFF